MESSASWIAISDIFRGVHAFASPRWLVGEPLWWEVATLYRNNRFNIVHVSEPHSGPSESLYAAGAASRQGNSRGKSII